MKILVLNGSPRVKGNTAQMCAAFAEGALQSGHEVTIVPVAQKRIAGCLACEYCHGKGEGSCIQQDDMQEIHALLQEADMVVLASPVYYWNFSGQLQTAISRFYNRAPKADKYALLLSSASKDVYDGAIYAYQKTVKWFKAEDMGMKAFNGTVTEGDLEEVKAFGASLK